jgi:nitric oxide reductase subunit B
MCAAMSVMTFALTVAGVLQVHLQRVLGESYMDVQDQLALFYWIRLGSGVFVLIAALMFLWALFVPGRERVPHARSLQAAE